MKKKWDSWEIIVMALDILYTLLVVTGVCLIAKFLIVFMLDFY